MMALSQILSISLAIVVSLGATTLLLEKNEIHVIQMKKHKTSPHHAQSRTAAADSAYSKHLTRFLCVLPFTSSRDNASFIVMRQRRDTLPTFKHSPPSLISRLAATAVTASAMTTFYFLVKGRRRQRSEVMKQLRRGGQHMRAYDAQEAAASHILPRFSLKSYLNAGILFGQWIIFWSRQSIPLLYTLELFYFFHQNCTQIASKMQNCEWAFEVYSS